MPVTYKDIALLSQKSLLAGTEKLPVSDTEYITPNQIASLAGGTPRVTTLPNGGIIQPNVFYDLTISTDTTITLADITDNNVLNVFHLIIKVPSGSTPTISWAFQTASPSGIYDSYFYVNGEWNPPVIGDTSVIYEVSLVVFNNVAIYGDGYTYRIAGGYCNYLG